MTRERRASSVMIPPALRMTCASPVFRPSTCSTVRRASTQATTASLRAGGMGSCPSVNWRAEAPLGRRTSSGTGVGAPLPGKRNPPRRPGGGAAACARVAGIVRAHGGPRPVVVVSALAGVTDALLGCVREGALRAFDTHLERHREIAQRLLGPEARGAFLSELERARGELAALVERIGREPALRARLEDEIVSYGERLSAPLVAAVLATAGLRARPAGARPRIGTHEPPRRAAPHTAATAP